MATFGEIKARVSDELSRSDITSARTVGSETLESAAEMAVLDAVDRYAHMGFGWNEERNTVATTAGQIYVTVPTGLRRETGVWIDISGSDYQMQKVSSEHIETLEAASDTQGQPALYSYLDGTFRLWPKPNAAYTLTVLGVYDSTALSAAGDTSDMTNNRTAARMLAAWAREYISRNLLLDEAGEVAAARERTLAENTLISQTNAKQATGTIKACL